MNFQIDKTAAAGSFLEGLRGVILDYFGWVVLVLLVIEGAVFLADRIIVNPGKAREGSA